MRFLADMGISQSTSKWLKGKGHDAIHLREQGLQSISDTEVIKKAVEEDRIILTCDLDFGDIMATSGGILGLTLKALAAPEGSHDSLVSCRHDVIKYNLL